LYEEAVEMVRRLNKASVSLLQRRLRIGYTRAARLIDRMEEEKIVGPAVEGSSRARCCRCEGKEPDKLLSGESYSPDKANSAF